jgi:hypothetical protein
MRPCLAALLLANASLVCAQNAAPVENNPPAKVLSIDRESLSSGRSRTSVERSTAALVKTLTSAKSTSYFIGLDSLSGPEQVLFLEGYDSFADMQKGFDALDKNPTLAASLERARNPEGESASNLDQLLLVLQDDMGYGAPVNVARIRYVELDRYHVKPGQEHSFEDLLKIYADGYKKAGMEVHWYTYEVTYGDQSGSEYVLMLPLESLSEADRFSATGKSTMYPLGAEQGNRVAELSAKCIDSSSNNLFRVDPRLSYPNPDWVKTAPEFWTVKAEPAPATSPTPRPAIPVSHPRPSMIPPL